MKDSNVVTLVKPEENDFLQDILKRGAQALLAQAIEAEVSDLLAEYSTVQTKKGHQAVVRNGKLPKRTIQTGIGDIEVSIPKVRDRSGQGIKFNSKLVPPYLKRSQKIEEFLPWLYLRGISTGDFSEALMPLFGENAKGLSANTISRLKRQWESDYDQWHKRQIKKRYTYIWADGIYSKVRMDDKLCLLVMIGVDDLGNKEILAIEDGYRESAQSWSEVINDLTARGMEAPKLLIADGALGLWKAATQCWPTTNHQRCWVHKTANVLNKVPKGMQPKIKAALHDIWEAETKEEAYQAFDSCVKRFEAKYPKAMNCLAKDKLEMLSFYDYPAQHWVHIRTSNPIESVFATIRLRTTRTKSCGSRVTTLAMAFKLMQVASKRWNKLRGHQHCAEVIRGVKFVNGEQVKMDQQQITL